MSETDSIGSVNRLDTPQDAVVSQPGRIRTAVNRLDKARDASRKLADDLDKARDASRKLADDLGPVRRAKDALTVTDRDPKKIIEFLKETTAAGIEVPPELPDGDRSARESLQELIDHWRNELEKLLRRPVVVPPLARYQREPLERLGQEGFKQLLDGPRFPRLQGRHLYKVDVLASNLEEMAIIECRFEECNLTGAKFGSATVLSRTAFIGCHLNLVEAGGAAPDPGEENIIAGLQAEMDEAEGNAFGGGLRVLSAVFDDCKWDGADFTLASFSNCIFHDMRVTRPGRRVILDRAAFSSCMMEQVEFRARLRRAQFTDCNLNGASFKDVELQNAVFNNCTLVGANFNAADLTGVTFCDSDLAGADFGALTGRNVALKQTVLFETDFLRAFNINLAQIEEGKPDWSSCSFPAGFRKTEVGTSARRAPSTPSIVPTEDASDV